MTGDKFRFRFAKSGTLRLVSHHDLMRCCERMLRRAAVPFKSTDGFHPTPRLVFALSLPLGVIGRDEVVELELTEPRDGDETARRAYRTGARGADVQSVASVPMKTTARLRRVVYALPLPADRVPQVERAAAELLAEPKVWVERLRPEREAAEHPTVCAGSVRGRTHPPGPLPEGKGVTRCHRGATNPKLLPLPSGRGGGEVSRLFLDLWVTQEGTARADELLTLLGIADLIDDGAVLERTTVELRDEITATDPADVRRTGRRTACR